MALICIASCIIHQHHFTTVQNITFILQMLIYVKQLIWETSELRSMKDPTTFIFFCLHECDSVCVCVCVCVCLCVCTYPSLPSVLSTLRVCIWTCVHLCLDSWTSQGHVAAYLPVRSQCDLKGESAHTAGDDQKCDCSGTKWTLSWLMTLLTVSTRECGKTVGEDD